MAAAGTTEEGTCGTSSNHEVLLPPLAGNYALALRRQREHSRPRGVGDAAAAVKELFQMMPFAPSAPPPRSGSISVRPRRLAIHGEAPLRMPIPPQTPHTPANIRRQFRLRREQQPQKVETSNRIASDEDVAHSNPESRCSNTSLCEGGLCDSDQWSALENCISKRT